MQHKFNYTCRVCKKKFGWSAKREYPRCPSCVRKRENKKKLAHYKKYSPTRRRAMAIVARAFADGSLVRQPCENCGEAVAIAHHDDYSKPLTVRWLCWSCHQYHHIENGPGLNSYAT